MNWPLATALILAFAVVVGNIMLLKHAAGLTITPKVQPKDTSPGQVLNDNASDNVAYSEPPPVRSKAE